MKVDFSFLPSMALAIIALSRAALRAELAASSCGDGEDEEEDEGRGRFSGLEIFKPEAGSVIKGAVIAGEFIKRGRRGVEAVVSMGSVFSGLRVNLAPVVAKRFSVEKEVTFYDTISWQMSYIVEVSFTEF